MPSLYLMRHAHAEGVGGEITRDFDRTLSQHGRRQVGILCLALRRRGVEFSRIWSSPVPRARETAQLVSEQMGPPRYDTLELLSPKGAAPNITPLLATMGPGDRWLLIGHEPDLGYLVQALSGQDMGFHTGTLLSLHWDTGRRQAEILWVISPDDAIG